MTVAYLGVGSNLGDRRAQLDEAVQALDWGDARVVARSSIYETEPVGGPDDQPAFLNLVIGVETSLGVRALFERCQGVEVALGRARDDEIRWGPRAIDIDLLLFGHEVVHDADLTVPHPRMTERAFVLLPLEEIARDVTIPGKGTVEDAVRALGKAEGVRALP
ncbi:MAG: 2-amino-4-hydroxy-6-hydroxymethyldihydropteridine diphosphokinase [Actinomycetota bacterium]